MQRYVEQLLEDIAAAKANLPVFFDDYDEEDYYMLPAHLEAEEAPYQKLKDWLQLEPIIFPPADRLSTLQIMKILDGLVSLMKHFNYILNFPSSVPPALRYSVFIKELDKNTPYLTYNYWQIDFCNYESMTCPFGTSFCTCKQYESLYDKANEEDENISEQDFQDAKELLDVTDFLFFDDDLDFEMDDDDYDDDFPF